MFFQHKKAQNNVVVRKIEKFHEFILTAKGLGKLVRYVTVRENLLVRYLMANVGHGCLTHHH